MFCWKGRHARQDITVAAAPEGKNEVKWKNESKALAFETWQLMAAISYQRSFSLAMDIWLFIIYCLTMDELVLDVEKQYQGGAFLPMIFTDRIYVIL